MGTHRVDLRETIHLLNQRYYQQWHRAERLERELARVRGRWWGPLVGWALYLKRKLVPTRPHPLEASLPAGETIEGTPGPAGGRVSVVIPLRDRVDLLRACLRSLRRTGDDIEYVLIDNGSREPATLRVLDRLRQRRGVKVLTWPGAFNFSALCNAGARQATGDYLLFLNNDTEVLTADWRERMVGLASRPDVGVVGALLLYPDQTIQHAGLFPDLQGRWVHAGRGRPAAELGGVRVVPGVTGACLLIRSALFAELGGFDESLPLTYSDVDLCRKAQQRGLKCVVTPDARFLHYEGLTRGFAGDEPGAEHLEAMAAFPAKG
jgi:GT2 family glycosyltransferase